MVSMLAAATYLNTDLNYCEPLWDIIHVDLHGRSRKSGMIV